MTRAEQLEWEARAGRPAAAAAVLAIAFQIAASVYLQVSLEERPDAADEFFRVVAEQEADFVVSGVIAGVGLLFLIPVLVFLYRATRFRRPEIPRVALILAVAGPVLAAVLGVLRQIELVSIADDFVATRPRFGTEAAEDQAEDFIDDSSLPVIGGVGLAANLSLGFAVVLLSLHAMRAGLTSRFLGIIGIIIGVLYVLPIPGGPQFVQFFWLGALAALFLGRWPGGRGPAWERGEPIPWPSAAEMHERREQERELPEAASVDPDTPRQDPRPGSRKRKRRKKR